LQFNEVDSPFYSTIGLYSELDHHKEKRREGKIYDVQTISLNDLLAKYEAPRRVDYLSIDTEGSEFEILRNVDFRQYSFGVITCEHNYSPMRERIFALLSSHGYVRKFEKVSRFDDWYIAPI
jgi:FkbM family methyltransferase